MPAISTAVNYNYIRKKLREECIALKSENLRLCSLCILKHMQKWVQFLSYVILYYFFPIGSLLDLQIRHL